jgi:P27 family predicted phage terminase small subunit
MPRGRKPTPTKLLLLRGSRRAKRRQGEPQPAQTLPDPPEHLGPVAQAEWQRLAPELHRIGVLTMADRATMAAYCQIYERWVYAEKYIQEQLVMVDKPTGRLVTNPLVRIAARSLDLMLRYMVELGLTPSSRVKLATGTIPVDDPLEAFLNRRPTPRPRKET